MHECISSLRPHAFVRIFTEGQEYSMLSRDHPTSAPCLSSGFEAAVAEIGPQIQVLPTPRLPPRSSTTLGGGCQEGAHADSSAASLSSQHTSAYVSIRQHRGQESAHADSSAASLSSMSTHIYMYIVVYGSIVAKKALAQIRRRPHE
jgi:hypothetical protein